MQRGVLGAALQFSQGRCAARRENWLSARGGEAGGPLPPGCRCPNMQRGSRPACIFGRLPLLRLACFCRRQRLGCAAPSGPAQRPTGQAARTALKAKAQSLYFNYDLYPPPTLLMCPPCRCAAVLLRLADFCGAGRRPLAKTGALRQLHLAVSAAGSARLSCPPSGGISSGLLHLPQAALGSAALHIPPGDLPKNKRCCGILSLGKGTVSLYYISGEKRLHF